MSQAEKNHPHPLDEQIRRALEPDSRAVQRVVASALAAEPGRPRRYRLMVMVAVPALVIAAALTLLLGRLASVPAGGVAEDPVPALILVKAERPPVYSISNIGDVITITKPNGQVRAISGGRS